MNNIGLWQITTTGPSRLAAGEVALERDLENWIEQDPSLLERGLVIVARQLELAAGPLDLLALDPQGRWVLIEIKRARLRREAVAQAIDYASCLWRLDPAWLRSECDKYLASRGVPDRLDGLLEARGRALEGEAEKRSVTIYLVGTGVDAGLERMVGFMADISDIELRAVTFSPFRDPQGNLLLAREIHEGADRPAAAVQKPGGSGPTAEMILASADRNGVGDIVRPLHDVAASLGLHVRPWYRSIMFAPPVARNRCLFTVWADRLPRHPGAVKVYVDAEGFEQFYGVKEAELLALVGLVGHGVVDRDGAKRLAEGVSKIVVPPNAE
jgi:hypothetical protein